MSVKERDYSERYRVLSCMYVYVCIANSVCFSEDIDGVMFYFYFLLEN